MPKIKTYTADLGGVPSASGRRASAADFGGEMGAALQGLGREGQQVAEQMLRQTESDDAREMMVGIARANAKFATAQQEAIQTGAELGPLREKFGEDLADVRSNARTAHGSKTFDYHEVQTLQAFDMRSLQINAQRAGAKAKLQAEDFASSLGQQVFNDPASLGYAQSRVDDFVANLPPGLSPEQQAEIGQELKFRLASDAVRGAVTINPEQTLKDLKAGKWALKPGQLPQEIDRAESQIRAVQAQREQAVRFAHWERTRVSDEKANVYLRDIFSNKFNAEVVNSDMSLTKDDAQGLITLNQRWWDTLDGAGRKSDPSVVNDFILRIYASEEDPNKVRNITPLLNAVRAGNVAVRDFRWLNAAIAEQRDPNNSSIGAQFGQMQRTLTDAFLNDPAYKHAQGRIKAADIMNRWTFAVRASMDERREANKSLHTLFDPASPDYVGTPNFIKRFEREAKGVPTVRSAAERDALPPGTMYQDAAGNIARTRDMRKFVPD